MPDKKLTDKEIVKGLEICSNDGDCKECPINPHRGNYGYCTSLAIKAALDLIYRLQAENERLCMELDEVIIAKDLLFDEAEALIKKTKAEAVKEFAERLKKDIFNTEYHIDRYYRRSIDNIVKEMERENNDR